MIEILKRLEAGEPCILHELRYGQQLMADWPNMIGSEYDEYVQTMLEDNMPKELNEKYLFDTEEIGCDPQNDEVRFTYLYAMAESFSSTAGVMCIFRHLFVHKIEPVVFQDDRPYYILMGHLGLEIVFRNSRVIGPVNLRDVLNLLREILE